MVKATDTRSRQEIVRPILNLNWPREHLTFSFQKEKLRLANVLQIEMVSKSLTNSI